MDLKRRWIHASWKEITVQPEQQKMVYTTGDWREWK